MSKIRLLTERTRPDRLISSVSVFPEIATDKIAGDLHVAEKGRERGKINQPPSDAGYYDSVESEIITELNRIRTIGFNRYSEHMETYARRLREASNSKAELRTLAETAVTDYQTSVIIHRNNLANHRQRVMERYLERKCFIKANALARTAHDPTHILWTIGLVGILILIESSMNGYFFASSNSLGLLGGVSVALVISVVNVGFSMMGGYQIRNLNHIQFIRKGWAVAILFALVAEVISFNFLVAHFRDAASNMPWERAVIHAIETFRTNIFALSNFESWLLFSVGMLICLSVIWKGYSIGDPYPGYAHVYHRWEKSREDYAEGAESARIELEELRNEAISDLEDARKTLTSNIKEAIDILYAKAGLSGQLEAFLNQSELVVNELLSIYRDANVQARTSPKPEHFKNNYTFKAITPFHNFNASPSEQKSAETEINDINIIVDETIHKIFNHYERAIISYESIEELEKQAENLQMFSCG